MTLEEKFYKVMVYPFSEYKEQMKVLKKENIIEYLKIADDFAIDFAEWLRGDYYSFGNGWMPFGKLKINNFTNKDLLKIYKKEKGL